MRVLVDGLAARFGGNARAMVEVASRLRRLPETDEVFVVVRRGSAVADELHVRGPSVLASPPAPAATELPFRLVWSALRLPRLAEEVDADAVLSFSGIVPRHPRRPVVSFVSSSAPFEGRIRGARLRRLAIGRTVKRSAAVYVPTRHMHDLLGVAAAKIVPWGVDSSIFRPAEQPGTEVLSVGDFYPHKRHDLVLDAWLRLPEPRPPLRVVGNAAVDRRCFEAFAAKARAQPGVVLEGPLPHAELAACYASARTIVLPSESESFCLPLAEAMACGVPAIARDHPALRETGGAGATFVAGSDPREWADAIRSLYDDEARHASLRAAGLEEARRFSWDELVATVASDCRP